MLPSSSSSRFPHPSAEPGSAWAVVTATAVITAAALTLAPAGPVHAQGFGVYESGACAQGRAGAVVAQPCDDGSAVFFNPSGVETAAGQTVLSVGFTGIFAQGSFDADGSESTIDLDNRQPIPLGHAYAVWSPSDRLSLALGAFAPYGLETTWPIDFEGRYIGYDNALQSAYLQPTMAYQVLPWLRLGAGIDIVFSNVELNRRLDLAEQPVPQGVPVPPGSTLGDLGIPRGTDFADVLLESDWAVEYGANVGVTVEASERVWIGLRYTSQTAVDYEGTATFEQVPTGIELGADNPFGAPAGTSLDQVIEAIGIFEPGGLLADGGVRTAITMPDQLVAGVSLRATDALLLEADYQFTDWSDFDRVVLDFTNEATPDEEIVLDYRDTHGVRIGADYAVSPTFNARGGFIYNQAAAPDFSVTPLLPEAQRQHLTAGLGWAATPSITVDGAYQLLLQDDRRGRVRSAPEGEPPTTALNTGVYGFTGHIVALTIGWIPGR